MSDKDLNIADDAHYLKYHHQGALDVTTTTCVHAQLTKDLNGIQEDNKIAL